MSSRPKVSAKVAEIIAQWANTESMLGLFLGFLLHADGKTTIAMYISLENRAAQLRMMDAAARSKLPPEHYDVCVIVLEQFLRPAMRLRDKLAHWCWGYSLELPNDLLLMEPAERISNHYAAMGAPALPLDKTKIFVVTEKYLDGVIRDGEAAQDYLAELMNSVWQSHPAEERARWLGILSTKPEIRRPLDHRRETRERLRGVPPILPEEWHGETP
jgi:hypothetical protein